MYVEGRVLTSGGEPVPGAVIETWETDDKGEQHFDFVQFFCGSLSTVVRSSFHARLLRHSVHRTPRTRLPR